MTRPLSGSTSKQNAPFQTASADTFRRKARDDVVPEPLPDLIVRRRSLG